MRDPALIPVGALLGGELYLRLHRALGRQYAIETIASVAEASRVNDGWLFIDPAAIEADDILRMSAKGTLDVSRVVLYTRLATPAIAKGIAKLSRGGVSALVLADLEDSPECLRSTLRSVARVEPRLPVIAELATALMDAPPQLVFALIQEFLGLCPEMACKQLAAAVGMDRRSVERWLNKLGLAPPKIALAAAHLVRAFPLLKDPSTPLYIVARENGFTSVRTLGRQCKLVFGLSPQLVRVSVTSEELPRLIYRRLRSQPPNPSCKRQSSG